MDSLLKKYTLKEITLFVTAVVAVVTLLFGIIKFFQIQEMEAKKPYLLKKLEWCTEAVEMASSIANSKDDSKISEQRFWQIYWGVMGLVEHDEIRNAMIDFGNNISSGKQCKLKEKSLAIAHACRKEMANDWSPSWAL
jgi:hypothetical protein